MKECDNDKDPTFSKSSKFNFEVITINEVSKFA